MRNNKTASLVESFWLYNFAGNLAISLFVLWVWPGRQPPPGPMIAWSAYVAFCCFLIWESAADYQGRRIWAIAAKASVIISIPMLLIMCGSLFTELVSRAGDLQPGRNVLAQLLWDQIPPRR